MDDIKIEGTGGGISAPVIEVHEEAVREHLRETVRGTVGEMRNALLEAARRTPCAKARRSERSAGRASTRAGHFMAQPRCG